MRRSHAPRRGRLQVKCIGVDDTGFKLSPALISVQHSPKLTLAHRVFYPLARTALAHPVAAELGTNHCIQKAPHTARYE